MGHTKAFFIFTLLLSSVLEVNGLQIDTQVIEEKELAKAEEIQIKKKKETLFGYVPEKSLIYRLHPLVRLVIFLVFAFTPIFIALPEANIAIIVGTAIVMLLANVDIGSLKKFVPLVFTMAIFIFLVYTFFPKEGSQIAITIGPIKTYYESLFWAFVIYCRILALVMASIFYVSMNTERDLLVAFHTLKLPYPIVFALGMAFRFAGQFIKDYDVIREAERARGLNPRSLGLKQQIRHYAMYVIPLFALALRRANDIEAALFVRGFTFSGFFERRESYARHKYALRISDIIWIIILVGFGIGIALSKPQLGIDNSWINRMLMRLIIGG